MSILVQDCIECQQNKQIITKSKPQPYKHSQKKLHISIIEYQRTQKDL